MISPHVDSYDWFLNTGLQRICQGLEPLEHADKKGNKVRVWYESLKVLEPTVGERETASEKRLLPRECRERRLSYLAPLVARVCMQINDGQIVAFQRKIGNLPMMVGATKCHTRGMTPKQLVAIKEEPREVGGYFICNGNERVLRMLAMPRRNHITAIIRPSFTKRGASYTQFGCTMRCVSEDATSQTIVLHYLSSGLINVRFALARQEFFIPAILLLKGLASGTDRSCYDAIVRGDEANTFVTNHVEIMLREAHSFTESGSMQDSLAHMGKSFRTLMQVPPHHTDRQVGENMIQSFIFIHLKNNADKARVLCVMIRKLLALVAQECAADSPDAVSNQEVLLPGHMICMFAKEKLQESLQLLRTVMLKDERMGSNQFDLQDERYCRKTMERLNYDVGKKLEYLLTTGNLVSKSGLDLMQVSGYTILAEKLNFLRFSSHFRCIHRGQFFMEMKTTSVRKLLPETWGFLCPVHTPDGSPCGLLNHLASTCEVITQDPDEVAEQPAISNVLAQHGMLPVEVPTMAPASQLVCMYNGNVIGYVATVDAQDAAEALRMAKVQGLPGISQYLEIALVMPLDRGEYAGLYLYSTPARMMRPVKHLHTGNQELIGSFEQIYMNVACLDEDVKGGGITTHQELKPQNMLSVLALMTPLSDFNQSPRNMYQCQMAKQAMATPYHSYQHRVDNKVYRIQTPQSPIVRNRAQDEYEMDEYPSGTNAIIAVIPFTGYDMEDAMIINKASYDRGFMAGCVYTVKIIDLEDKKSSAGAPLYFGNHLPGETDRVCANLDDDGLPHIGQRMVKGDPLWCAIDESSCRAKKELHNYNEEATVEEVRLLASKSGKGPLQQVLLKFRFDRAPVIGDKFATRAGQKGVMSQLWPSENIPFSESGMQPDIMFNPHGFPSRMTIGMILEIMAGKAGALHGVHQDSTPFQFREDQPAVEHFGEQLQQAGFDYYGSENLYCGTTGVCMEAEIFMGIVHYQRLRHMVSDKYQVRATGPVNRVHLQPIKGRKVGGGVRFGEMERDSLLAHGTAYLLHDRLMKCSDYATAYVCSRCGSLLAPLHTPQTGNRGYKQPNASIMTVSPTSKVRCSSAECAGLPSQCHLVHMPAVFKYLANEIAAMNVRMTLEVVDSTQRNSSSLNQN